MYLELNENCTILTLADDKNLLDHDTQRIELDLHDVRDLIIKLKCNLEYMKVDAKKIKIAELHRQKQEIETQLKVLGE